MARLVFKLSAVDPYSLPEIEIITVGLEQGQMDALLKNAHEVRFARLKLVKCVLEEPDAVFKDWKRPEHEDGLCYVGSPKVDFRSTSIEVPPPPNMLFLVFVKPSGKITDWRWELRDADHPEYPEGWETRFGERIWPPNP